MQKSVILTNEQIRRFKGRVLKEAFAVNTALVRKIYSFIVKNYSFVQYDDIDENGDVVQRFAFQSLSSNGEPLQTISPEKMLDKMDSKFSGVIKDNKERRDFIKQILIDWLDGNDASLKNGMLSVNSTGV